jgi:hypothetical protein
MDWVFYASHKALNHFYIYLGNWSIYSAHWMEHAGS